MNKEDYINITKEKIKNESSKRLMLKQIDTYYEIKDSYKIEESKYAIGDEVVLKKGTLLHGTYKNIDGLKAIVKDGLISSWFIDGRSSKYPSSVGVWNLKKDYNLSEYIDLYSGGTLKIINSFLGNKYNTRLIRYSDMKNLMNILGEEKFVWWEMQQTKESRFMPCLFENEVEIVIIFENNNKILAGDILSCAVSDDEVKEFVNEKYYDEFIETRKNKDDFFTDRESAILFGLPANLIEGVLVGRNYEKDESILNEIKTILPNCYICNLDGVVIR